MKNIMILLLCSIGFIASTVPAQAQDISNLLDRIDFPDIQIDSVLLAIEADPVIFEDYYDVIISAAEKPEDLDKVLKDLYAKGDKTTANTIKHLSRTYHKGKKQTLSYQSYVGSYMGSLARTLE